MQPHSRRAVAFIAASLLRDGGARAIIDLASNEVHAFEGEVTPTRVAIADRLEGGFVSGFRTDGCLSLHDHGAHQFFTLELDGERFGGFDYGSNTYYSGDIDADVVRIHDEHSVGVFCYSTCVG